MLRFLPPVLGVVGAIAGMAIVTALVPLQSKALPPYTNSILSLDRLRTIDYFKIGTSRTPEGLLVYLSPQSTKAIRSQFGSPASVTEDKDIYLAFGVYDGIYANQQIIFYYETNSATGFVPKATSALIPQGLLRR